MFRMTRSGMQLEADAPSWSLAREVIHQRASELGVALISHEADLVSLAPEERLGILEMKVLPVLVARTVVENESKSEKDKRKMM